MRKWLVRLLLGNPAADALAELERNAAAERAAERALHLEPPESQATSDGEAATTPEGT